MDEMIALAVGIPSVILAGVAVNYARRNDAFQKVMMFVKRHKNNGGNHQEWVGDRTNVGSYRLDSSEWRPGYNDWHQNTGQASNYGHTGSRGAYY